MNRTNYIGNLAAKVALGATLLFSAPNVGANGGSGYPSDQNARINYRLNNIESRLEKIEDRLETTNDIITGVATGVALGSFLVIGLGLYVVSRPRKKN